MENQEQRCLSECKLDIEQRYLSGYKQAQIFLSKIGVDFSIHTLHKYVSMGRMPYLKAAGTAKVIFKPQELIDWIEGSKS